MELDDNPLSQVNLETIVSREIQKYKNINDQKINRLNQQISTLKKSPPTSQQSTDKSSKKVPRGDTKSQQAASLKK